MTLVCYLCKSICISQYLKLSRWVHAAEAQGTPGFWQSYPSCSWSIVLVGDIAPREGIPKEEKRRLEAVRNFGSISWWPAYVYWQRYRRQCITLCTKCCITVQQHSVFTPCGKSMKREKLLKPGLSRVCDKFLQGPHSTFLTFALQFRPARSWQVWDGIPRYDPSHLSNFTAPLSCSPNPDAQHLNMRRITPWPHSSHSLTAAFPIYGTQKFSNGDKTCSLSEVNTKRVVTTEKNFKRKSRNLADRVYAYTLPLRVVHIWRCHLISRSTING